MSDTVYVIYGIENPFTQKVMYVGMSKDVQKRFKQHLHKAAPWIREIVERGKQPILRILENDIADLPTARQREQHWICHFEGQDCPLVNLLGNEAAHREREERADLYRRVYAEFDYLAPEMADKLTRMTIAGYDTVGFCAWDTKYEAVWGTIKLLERKPEFGLHLTEMDAIKLTFNLFGYEWKGEGEQ